VRRNHPLFNDRLMAVDGETAAIKSAFRKKWMAAVDCHLHFFPMAGPDGWVDGSFFWRNSPVDSKAPRTGGKVSHHIRPAPPSIGEQT